MFLLFGTAEDHDSTRSRWVWRGSRNAARRSSAINPIRTGYNAIADEWIGITPGTDGLLVLSLVHCLLKAGKVDLDYLSRWTNAPLPAERGSEHPRLRPADAGRQGPAGGDGPGHRRPPPSTSRASGRISRGASARGGTTQRTVFQAAGGALPGTGIRPRGGRVAGRHPGGADPPAGRRTRACGLRAELRGGAGLDRFPRRAPRPRDGAAGRHARDARDLGPFQRLPDGPRDPPAADPAGSGGMPGGMRFKPPYPKPAEAHPRPMRAQSRTRRSTGRIWASRDGPEDLLPGRGRQAAAARQGVLLGEPAVGARADAHGDLERLCGRSLPRSTRCSSTWRTWPGTRR